MALAIIVMTGYNCEMTLGRTDRALWLTVGVWRKEKLRTDLRLMT